MAQYTITHTCGNTQHIRLFGKNDERYRQIEAMERRKCPECEAAAAQQYAKDQGWPVLEGSAKQISWAADIRLNKIKDAQKKLARFDELLKGVPPESLDKATAELQQMHANFDRFVNKCTNAGWLIDNQHRLDTRSILTGSF